MSQSIRIQYSDHTVHYTTQFMATAGDQEVILDCGSVVVDVDPQQRQLPVHTRMALPWPAVERLHELLTRLIDAKSNSSGIVEPLSQCPPSQVECTTAHPPHATLPPLAQTRQDSLQTEHHQPE